MILFKAKRFTLYNIGYHTGIYGTDSLRRFNYDSGGGTWMLGTGTTIKRWKARQPAFDTWHYFAITRFANGDVSASLWERDNPKHRIEFHENLGKQWGTLELTFLIDFRWGAFTLDEYQELK